MTSMRSAPPYNNSAMPALKHLNIGMAKGAPESYAGPRAAGQANFLQMSGADSDSDSDSDSDAGRPNQASALTDISQVRPSDQQHTAPIQQQQSTSVKNVSPDQHAYFAQNIPTQRNASIEQKAPKPTYLAAVAREAATSQPEHSSMREAAATQPEHPSVTPAARDAATIQPTLLSLAPAAREVGTTQPEHPQVREAATTQPEYPSVMPAAREVASSQPEQVSESETLPKTTSVTTVRRVNLDEENGARSESPLPNPHSQSQNGTLFDIWNSNPLDLDQSSSKSKHSSWRKSEVVSGPSVAPKGSDAESQRSIPSTTYEHSPSPAYDNEPARKATSMFRSQTFINPFDASQKPDQYESKYDYQTLENGPSDDYARYQEQAQGSHEYQEQYPQYAQDSNTYPEEYQQHNYEQGGHSEEYQQYEQEFPEEAQEHQAFNDNAQQYQDEQADYQTQELPTDSNVLHHDSYQLDAGQYQSQDRNLPSAYQNEEQEWDLNNTGDNHYGHQHAEYDQSAWDSQHPEQYNYEQRQYESAGYEQEGEKMADPAYNQEDHHPSLHGDEFFVIDDGAAALMSDPRRNASPSNDDDQLNTSMYQSAAQAKSPEVTPLKSNLDRDIRKSSDSQNEIVQNSDRDEIPYEQLEARRLSSDETQSAAMLPPQQTASQSTPDKSLKNTASRFFRKVISPKQQRKSETATTPTRRPERFTEQFGERPTDSAFASDQQRSVGRISEESTTSSVLDLAGGVDPKPNSRAAKTNSTPTKEIGSPSPKTKSNLRQRLRNKYNFFPSRNSSENPTANTEDEMRGLRSNDKLPRSNVTEVQNASVEDVASPKSGAMSGDVPSRPSMAGSESQTYGLPREPSPYYTSDNLFDRPGETRSNRRSERSGHRSNPLQTFLRRFGGHSSSAQTPKDKQEPASQAHEEPVPFQHELRRRESVIRAHRRSRSVGGVDVRGMSLDAGQQDAAKSATEPESWQQNDPTFKASNTEDARRTKYLSVNSTSASNRDSFATAHSNQEPLMQDTLAPPPTGSTPTSSGRNSQRFSQSNDSRMSDSQSLFSHTSQSTHPTSAAQSNTDLSKPVSGRGGQGQSNASSKRQSAQGFQPSTLPSMVSEVPSPKLGMMHDENERESFSPLNNQSRTDATPSKRLSLGLNDDSWLLDLDFDRATNDKSAVNNLGSSLDPGFSQGLMSTTSGPRAQSRAVPNNRISDEEPLSLNLPDSINLSPVLMNYL
ncbi:hypothetical protein MYAM1_003378 [Malassezia yamatoensis]|uniref:Uncharacterized protein n=1 Tax=Malassezia yamatoensis TaxID=253288 RepID=A0AAJ5YXP2_9BASI|nr:hypothetical protein MYAM1_003378 [Malassezia yamatoensis]